MRILIFSEKKLLESTPNSIFNIYNLHGIKQLTKLCPGLSNFNEHKFKHGSNVTINLICICEGGTESINHFFLHGPEFSEAR